MVSLKKQKYVMLDTEKFLSQGRHFMECHMSKICHYIYVYFQVTFMGHILTKCALPYYGVLLYIIIAFIKQSKNVVEKD